MKLAPQVLERLEAICARRGTPRAATEHWRSYGGMSRVHFDRGRGLAVIEAGAGFDGEYELNFRGPSLRERVGALLAGGRRHGQTARFLQAFGECGGTPARLEEAMRVLGPPLQPHKILAAHYQDVLEHHDGLGSVRSYLEIGPGSGYLATPVRARTGARLLLVDLPEMLPYAFLYLHKRFPEEPFSLLGEGIKGAAIAFLTPGTLDEVPQRAVELAANTASFAEMLPEEVARYFSFLRSVVAPHGLFFTVNREEKLMTPVARPGETVPVRFDGYP